MKLEQDTLLLPQRKDVQNALDRAREVGVDKKTVGWADPLGAKPFSRRDSHAHVL